MTVTPTHYDIPCLECGAIVAVDKKGATAQYGLNVFCPDKDCEDIYANKL